LVLAAWRILSLRFAFPTQPGHWLFVVIASFALLIYARTDLQAAGVGQNTSIGQDMPDFIVAIATTAVALIAALFCWRQAVHWQVAFLVLLSGQAMQTVSYLLVFLWRTAEPTPFFGLGVYISLAFPLIAISCAAIDLADRNRYDIFHWLGIGTLIGAIAHGVSIIGVSRLV
jgi:hypothetical protein